MDETSISELSPDEGRRAKKNARARQRRQDHPEEVRAVQRAWYQKNIEKRRAQGRHRSAARRRNHPDKVQAENKKSKTAHKLSIAVAWQEYYAKNHDRLVRQSRLWRELHPEQRQATEKHWKQTHHEQCLAQWARKRARKRHAPINDFTAKQWRALCKAAGYLCAYCKQKFPFKQLTMDHITPLSKGGSHTLSNILPACLDCNMRKHANAVLTPVQPFLLLPDEDAAAD